MMHNKNLRSVGTTYHQDSIWPGSIVILDSNKSIKTKNSNHNLYPESQRQSDSLEVKLGSLTFIRRTLPSRAIFLVCAHKD